jgi:hypothetical protein
MTNKAYEVYYCDASNPYMLRLDVCDHFNRSGLDRLLTEYPTITAVIRFDYNPTSGTTFTLVYGSGFNDTIERQVNYILSEIQYLFN